MAHFRSPSHVANRISKIEKILADGKLNPMTIRFKLGATLADNFRINSRDMTSIDLQANAGADITFNFPDDSPGSETFTIVKTDILIVNRLRTKKYLIDIQSVARVTIV